MRSALPQPAPTKATLPTGTAPMQASASSCVSGDPFAMQASNKARNAAARSLCSDSLFFSVGRMDSSQASISSKFSGSSSRNSSLKYAAAVGLAPPVEMPAENAPCCTSAGKKKLHREGSSATFTGICRF